MNSCHRAYRSHADARRICVLQLGGLLSANISGKSGQPAATPVGAKQDKWLGKVSLKMDIYLHFLSNDLDQQSRSGDLLLVRDHGSLVGLCMQDFRSVCTTVTICARVQTHTHTHRQAAFLLSYMSSSAIQTKFGTDDNGWYRIISWSQCMYLMDEETDGRTDKQNCNNNTMHYIPCSGTVTTMEAEHTRRNCPWTRLDWPH